MGSFAEARKEQLSKWMGGPEGEALAQVFGDRQDALALELKKAVKARFPGIYLENGTADALPHTGAERKMWRYPRESDASYAHRQHLAPLLWYWGGTKAAMYNVFAPVDDTYIEPTETWRMVEMGEASVLVNRHAASTSTKLYVVNDCEGPVVAGDHYSAYAMMYDARDGEWGPGVNWGTGTWDNGTLWDTNMSVEEARYLIAQILTWKAVISYPVRIALWFAGAQGFWNGGLTWDDGSDWGDAPATDTPYLTIGHCWQEHAAQGGWIDDAPAQTIQVWDGGQLWVGYENPRTFGTEIGS